MDAPHSMFKFLHAADIHLDSPLRGLQRYEGAPVDEIRQATRRAFENLVQLAIDQSVAFVLIAGDLYDGDWKDHRTGLYFVSQMVRLREAGIPVVIIAGNHDAANKMTRTLPLPENVHMIDAKRPETFCLERWGVAIHGQSFATGSVLEDLSAGYPPAVSGMLNIGLLHTCASGREGHQPYAPCTISGLISKQYDYWALGHVHGHEVLTREPHIIFSGNTQGRHIREPGPKGCILAHLESLEILRPGLRPLDVFRWQTCWVDAAGATTRDVLLDRIRQQLAAIIQGNDGLSLAVRVETSGACKAHREIAARPEQWINDVRSLALDVGGGRVWIEKVHTATTLPVNLDEAVLSDGPVGELARLIEELRGDPEAIERLLAEDLGELRKKLPPELTEGPEAIDLGKSETTSGMLDQVRQMLVGQLVSREAAK
jgi:DNA repair exonuclease SbcCD nuclease subunit